MFTLHVHAHDKLGKTIQLYKKAILFLGDTVAFFAFFKKMNENMKYFKRALF